MQQELKELKEDQVQQEPKVLQEVHKELKVLKEELEQEVLKVHKVEHQDQVLKVHKEDLVVLELKVLHLKVQQEPKEPKVHKDLHQIKD